MASKILFHALFFTFFVLGTHAITMTIKNNCGGKIWPAALSSGGGAPSRTGFELAPQATSNIVVSAQWSGRIWARTGCSNAGTSCATGDCGSGSVSCNGHGGVPPATLVEFTLRSPNTPTKDFFDISLVDGFNLPVKVTPQGNCQARSCAVDIRSKCPANLAIIGGNGKRIACKSACLQFNDDQNCCRGAYNSAATCKPSQYSNIVKQSCPDAYSYAYDDASSLFTCPTGLNYVIEFCP